MRFNEFESLRTHVHKKCFACDLDSAIIVWVWKCSFRFFVISRNIFSGRTYKAAFNPEKKDHANPSYFFISLE